IARSINLVWLQQEQSRLPQTIHAQVSCDAEQPAAQRAVASKCCRLLECAQERLRGNLLCILSAPQQVAGIRKHTINMELEKRIHGVGISRLKAGEQPAL